MSVGFEPLPDSLKRRIGLLVQQAYDCCGETFALPLQIAATSMKNLPLAACSENAQCAASSHKELMPLCATRDARRTATTVAASRIPRQDTALLVLRAGVSV